MHPTDEQILDTLLGGPADSGLEETRAHVDSGCSRCEERLAMFRELVHTLRTDRDPEPPAEWVRRANRLLSPHSLPVIAERVKDFCRGLVEEAARLVRDTAATPGVAAFGLRGESTRRLGFETEGFELDVAIEPRAGGATVTGQVTALGDDPTSIPDAKVLLSGPRGSVHETITDEGGEFA
ncbi:MAG: hypothetical protein KC591_04880, partial [Gemmatimonadetes bacterium]|nr:hypothetical protein [Gemmatimonadota bacterium]